MENEYEVGDKVKLFGRMGIWTIEEIYLSKKEVEISSGFQVLTVSLEELEKINN